MKKILLFLIPFIYGVNAQTQSILVTPEWLKDHLNDPNLVLVHVSNLKYDYDKEHIAGARYLWPASLAPDSPYGNFNAPDPKRLLKFSVDWEYQTTRILCSITFEMK